MLTTATGLNAMCIPGIFQCGGRTRTRPQAKLNGEIPADDAAIDLVVAMDTQTPWVLGTGAGVVVNPGQYSLSTTIMHELCHGLGFLGLCNVNAAAQTGIYTDAASLIPAVNGIVALMNPAVVIPAHFFPPYPHSGMGAITPFANLFTYTDPALTKGVPADDYTAFITPHTIQLTAGGHAYEVLSQNPFHPFTTCDHITGADYLMNSSTAGQYYQAPDNASKEILAAIGWTLV